LARESYRRTLKDKGQLSLRVHPAKKHEGEILTIAKRTVMTIAPTTPIYEAIKIMGKEGFRRLPITNAGTQALEGTVTATDIINYLGGGEKFHIIEQKFEGNIFKAINGPIKLIMNPKVVSISANAKISDAINLMKEKHVGGLPVVDENKRVKAIVTERDITNLFADKMSGVNVAELMSKEVVTALPKTTIHEAEKVMSMQGFRRLPIISDGKVAGIVTAMDVLRFFGSGEVFKHLKSGTIGQVLTTPALQIASKDVSTIEPDADIGQAAKLMHSRDIGALPVVKNQKIVGIITERDFFKVIE
jgi:CBS domain-containing protein